ncbi:type II toxin-antitoxin system antitoxin DNA ADP-ribosyl glycohydrolase DarG [Pseudonocardia lacus]|uniref:type II toxin-antitoxin system antitoxin DNA ADP-ribosyl glycohydrolase DarG n=1 Tax=Pseudonocardia lacus TaxID=2835865 RepID=UPI001BDCC2EE|nr:macro domain-containing protein [Pseudonocardia lacus]
MILEGTGNLLEADVEALVNTVNTVGVMGKGIALQFKRAFPGNFRSYAEACRRNEVALGTMFTCSVDGLGNPKLIVNFPTKGHWRSKSRIQDIEAGLVDLRRIIDERGIRSIAVPPLGCGNGGLDWSDVRPLIISAFSDLADVEVHLFAPAGAPDASAMPVNTDRPTMTRDYAAMLLAFELYIARSAAAGLNMNSKLSLMEAQKVAYFMQLCGWPSDFDFVPSYYGPYSQGMNQFISEIEGHFIVGFGDGTGGSRATISLRGGALAEAHEMLDRDPQFQHVIDKFTGVVAGFEFPYGMELLSTVHFAATRLTGRTPAGVPSVMQAIDSWSERKAQLFRAEQASRAYDHLSVLHAL